MEQEFVWTKHTGIDGKICTMQIGAQNSLPPLSKYAVVLVREPAKWETRYKVLKRIVFDCHDWTLTIQPLLCPHTMQSFWTRRLLDLSAELCETGTKYYGM
jgi:hypothetical protein